MTKGIDRSIRIIAKPDTSATEGYSFSLDDGKGGAADLVFNKDDVNGMKKNDYFVVRFDLENQDGANLVFAKDREVVLWACPLSLADPTTHCPPDNSYMETTFYVHPSKKIQDKRLYVINTDMENEQFAFAFNFLNKDDAGKKYVKFDPVGTNKNGGEPPFADAQRVSALLVGVVSAIGAAFVTYALTR